MLVKEKFESGLERVLYSPTIRYAHSRARTSAILRSDNLVSVSGYKCCKSPTINDFSSMSGQWTHYYCSSCGSHVYNGKEYTKSEWEEYINGGDDD